MITVKVSSDVFTGVYTVLAEMVICFLVQKMFIIFRSRHAKKRIFEDGQSIPLRVLTIPEIEWRVPVTLAWWNLLTVIIVTITFLTAKLCNFGIRGITELRVHEYEEAFQSHIAAPEWVTSLDTSVRLVDGKPELKASTLALLRQGSCSATTFPAASLYRIRFSRDKNEFIGSEGAADFYRELKCISDSNLEAPLVEAFMPPPLLNGCDELENDGLLKVTYNWTEPGVEGSLAASVEICGRAATLACHRDTCVIADFNFPNRTELYKLEIQRNSSTPGTPFYKNRFKVMTVRGLFSGAHLGLGEPLPSIARSLVRVLATPITVTSGEALIYSRIDFKRGKVASVVAAEDVTILQTWVVCVYICVTAVALICSVILVVLSHFRYRDRSNYIDPLNPSAALDVLIRERINSGDSRIAVKDKRGLSIGVLRDKPHFTIGHKNDMGGARWPEDEI